MWESQDDVSELMAEPMQQDIKSENQKGSLHYLMSCRMTPIVNGCSSSGIVFSDESWNCYYFNALKQYVHVNSLESDNLNLALVDGR